MSDYAQGFKDGFAAGLEEGKKLIPKDTVFQPSYLGMPGTCQICGRSGVAGYVCYDPKCPTRVTCGTPMTAYSTGPTGGPVTGAVGSEQQYDARGWRVK